MKSEKAKRYLLKVVAPIAMMYPEHPEECDLKLGEAKRAVELAEQESEERVRTKAHKIVKEMMTGIFQGDMPRKIADEFIQKLNDDEND